MTTLPKLLLLLAALFAALAETGASGVAVDTIKAGDGPAVTRASTYRAHVTLYIEDVAGGTKTPSGWSTRKEDGAAADEPFEFQPGVNLIPGWTEGVLKMREGERAELHVPSVLGYGSRPMGSEGGAFYIPADSDLLFDIEILGKVGGADAGGAEDEM